MALNRFFGKKPSTPSDSGDNGKIKLATKTNFKRPKPPRPLDPEDIEKARKKRFDAFFRIFRRRSVTGKELAVFTRQLAATVNAGLLLTEALETISDEAENLYLQQIIMQISKDIQSGYDFSSALARHPKIFPDDYVSIVKSGEAGGGLAKTLTNLAKYLENVEKLKAKIKSAVRYPIFVFGFAMVVVSVIVLFLIPKFKDMYDQAGAQLPMLTRVVVATSDFSIKYFPFLLAGIVILIFAYWFCLRFPAFRYAIDAIKLRLPIIGKEIIHKSIVSRFCHTFGFLLGRGVGLAQSLQISAQAVDNMPLAQAVDRIRAKVLSGGSISQQLKTQDLFPHLVSKMAAVGEKTGTLATMLERTGEYYDDELEISVQNLMVMIEPVLIVFVGSIVCIVIVALYLPIFKIGAMVK